MTNKPTAVDLQSETVILGGLNYNVDLSIESVARHFQPLGVELLIKLHSMQVAGH